MVVTTITRPLPNENCVWNGSTPFSSLGVNPCQRRGADLMMLVGSSCVHTSDLISPYPLPEIPLHAFRLLKTDFCPYVGAGVGGTWWETCSTSCPAQQGSTCTTFHQSNILHMAPCLRLCSVEPVPKKKKVGGVIRESGQQSPALSFLSIINKICLPLTHAGCPQEACLLLYHLAQFG